MKKILIKNLYIDNIVILLSFVIISSALVYYFFSLNNSGIIAAGLLAAISTAIFIRLNSRHRDSREAISWRQNLRSFSSWPAIAFLLFWLAAIASLIAGRSGRALISPWETAGGSVFLFYALASWSWLIAVRQTDVTATVKKILFGLHYFLSVGAATIVYRVGYGFDPFIHQAAMEMIDKFGSIAPKTPYYLGEYGLIVSLHKISGLAIALLNRFLVPIAAAALLPAAALSLAEHSGKDGAHHNYLFPAALLSLVFSWPLFIATTPQNFSYIFLLLAIVSGLTDRLPYRTTIFSLAACAIHPLTGIPALIWSAWLIFKRWQGKLPIRFRKIISAAILSGGALLLPLALLMSGGAHWLDFSDGLENALKPIAEAFSPRAAGGEDWLLNLTYFIFYNYRFLLVFALIIGAISFRRHKDLWPEHERHAWQGLATISLSLMGAYLVSSWIGFSGLIVYEQSGYSSRILTIIALFWSPYLILAAKAIIMRLQANAELATKAIWIGFALIFMTTSYYLAYPRFDRYFNSRGYSTSDFDLEAVRRIASESKQDYVVLANQQVSAAALDQLGFNHYYQNPSYGAIYFYPIPTGGPLYQYYLDMVYKKASRETVLAAMDLASVNEAYFVINKYWRDSGKIIAAAKLNADSFETVGDNDLFIFKYSR